MRSGKWILAGALMRVPIFYKVVLANSAMAGIVIATLLLLHDDVMAVGTIVLSCGFVNALLVRAAFSVDHLREQQREVLAWTIAESERERGRVASAIHDGAAQRLAALILRTGDRNLTSEAAAVMQELCDTASTLQPPGIALLGLEGALKWYGRTVRERSGLEVDLGVACPPGALPHDLALGAFRLVEDAVGTAAAADAGSAALFVQCDEGHLMISIRLSHEFTATEQFRLAERAALLRGLLDIARDDADTLIRITIPLRGSHV